MIRIGVVGGGPGGLIVARLLDQKLESDYELTIIEAEDRLGGKLLTRRFESTGGLFEAGLAELYDYSETGNDPLRELITNDLGLETVPMDSDCIAIGDLIINDRSEIAERIGAKSAAAVERFRSRCATIISPFDYYDSLPATDNAYPWSSKSQEQLLFEEIDDDFARRYLRVAAHSDVAIGPGQTTALNGLKNHLFDVDGYLEIYSVVGGNERIAQELVKQIDADILLNTRVRRIGRAPGGHEYQLTAVRDGEELTYQFDLVFVCLPLNWLLTLEWDGRELTEAMTRHANHFYYPAHYLKVSAAFKSRFWRDAIGGQSWFLSDAFNGCCVYDDSARYDHSQFGGLSWLIAGHDALAFTGLSDDRLIKLAVDSLPASLRQEARAQLLESSVERWPFSVNGTPAGYPERSARINHMPEPSEHPGLFVVGDYVFDATLNAVYDSADYATDIARAELIRLTHAAQFKAPSPAGEGLEATPAQIAQSAVLLSEPQFLIDLCAQAFDIHPPFSLLDVGGLTKSSAPALESRGVSWHSIDPIALRDSRGHGDGTSAGESKADTSLPLPGATFDIVLDSWSCYFSREEIGPALARMRQLTRRGLVRLFVTADVPLAVLEKDRLLSGVKTFAGWWDWYEMVREAGFTLALSADDRLEIAWETAIRAGLGSDGWFDDAEALRHALFVPST